MTTAELFKAVRKAADAAVATAEVDCCALWSERVDVKDDLRDPDRSFMVQKLRLPEGEVVCRKRFYLPRDSEIVVCDGVEFPLDNSDVQLGGRASTAGAGFLELLEPVNKYGVEGLKWRPARGKPPVDPQEFTRLALEDLLSRSEVH